MFARGKTESSVEDADDRTIVASGGTAEINGTNTVGKYVLLYKSKEGIDLEQLESEFESSLDEGGELDDISKNERMVTIEYTTPTTTMG